MVDLPAGLRARLPATYFKWIEAGTLRVRDTVTGKRWRVLSPAMLMETVEVRPAPPEPAFRSLIAYAQMLLSVGVAPTRKAHASPTAPRTGDILSPEVAAASVVLAEENGDLLFVLDGDHSVWVFWPAGGDIQRVAGALAELVPAPSPSRRTRS